MTSKYGDWVRAPGGGVIARFYGADPSVDCGSLELFVQAPSRADAVRRARELGMHGVSLKSRNFEIGDEDVNAVLQSGSDAVWRREADWEAGRWRTMQEWPLKGT